MTWRNQLGPPRFRFGVDLELIHIRGGQGCRWGFTLAQSRPTTRPHVGSDRGIRCPFERGGCLRRRALRRLSLPPCRPSPPPTPPVACHPERYGRSPP